MNYRLFSFAVTLIVVLQSHISGAVIFQDDFSDALISYQNWASSNPDFNKITFPEGACKVENSSTQYVADVSIEKNLPSTFTYSCTVIRSSIADTAGIGFYLSTSSAAYILLTDRYILLSKPGENGSAAGVSCPYIAASINKISVSRKDAIYNVFINDQLTTTFTDNQARSGNYGFVNYPGATATYDNVVVTDEFQEGTVRKCYADGFDDPSLKFWDVTNKKCVPIVDSSKLRITSENNDSAYCIFITSLKLTNFVMRLEVSHIEGSGQSTYGLLLYDSSYKKTASFAITGDRTFASALGGEKPLMNTSTKIWGKAAIIGEQLRYFTDTLEVVKYSTSSNYYFVVNNTTIDTLTGIDFEIANVGFFCQNNLTLKFDNFAAAEGDSAYCPSVVRLKNRYTKGFTILPAKSIRTYDILGRSIPAIKLNGNIFQGSRLSSGIYVDNIDKKGRLEIK